MSKEVDAAITADRESLARDYERKAANHEGLPYSSARPTSAEMAAFFRAVAKTIRNFPRATASTDPSPTGGPKL